MFQASALTVMIASPSDVPEERKAVAEEVHRWNDANALARKLVLLPVMWETHSTPQMGEAPQEILNRQLLVNADILVGIFGSRIGTPTAEFASGSVEEIKKHVAAGKTAKVYFSDGPIQRDGFNADQFAAVEKFREECKKAGLYATFKDTDDFRRMFRQHLDIELNQPRYLWLPSLADAVSGANAKPSENAYRLIRAVANDGGTFIIQETMDGVGLRVGDEEFIDGTARSAVKWRAVIAELIDHNAAEQVSEDVYRLTAHGYDLADEAETRPDSGPSAFDLHRDKQMREIVWKLTHQQRDMLRKVMISGGRTQNTVLFKNWQTPTFPFDFNAMTLPLVDAGIVEVESDLIKGTSTVTILDSVQEVLKGILFPREEDKPPSFSGL